MPEDARYNRSAAQSPERMRDYAIASLVPFFADGTIDDDAARAVAESLLDEYQAANPKELQLAAQIVAQTWTSLACLSAAMVVKATSLEEMLTLQDHAIALDRSAQKVTKALDARRKDRAKRPNSVTREGTQWDEGTFQLTINQALDTLVLANDRRTACALPAASGGAPADLPPSPGDRATPALLKRRRRT